MRSKPRAGRKQYFYIGWVSDSSWTTALKHQDHLLDAIMKPFRLYIISIEMLAGQLTYISKNVWCKKMACLSPSIMNVTLVILLERAICVPKMGMIEQRLCIFWCKAFRDPFLAFSRARDFINLTKLENWSIINQYGTCRKHSLRDFTASCWVRVMPLPRTLRYS